MAEIDFTIAHNINKYFPDGTIVDKWPLHVTISPPFVKPDSLEIVDIEKIIRECGRSLAPIQFEFGELDSGAIPAKIGQSAIYGTKSEPIDVIKIIDVSGRLKELHVRVVTRLGETGCIFNNLEWALDHYSSHASTKSGLILRKPFLIQDVSVYENNRSNQEKTIISTVDLVE